MLISVAAPLDDSLASGMNESEISAQAGAITRVQVLLPDEEAGRFDAYCKAKGFKKSTLIARLVREFLDRESFMSPAKKARS